MSLPRVLTVAPGSPAARAGVCVDDELVAVDGRAPRDVLEYRWAVDEADPVLDLRRGGMDVRVEVAKVAGEALGLEISSAVFDRVQTCDNHCPFCFIHQLPAGMRRSLSLRDDDYRLSFLYGNFTTLTRFTEADLERVLTEGLSPLHVSIHATDPAVRTAMLRNRRGGTSLRWLRALLDAGIEVHGQVVVCPGVNDGSVLEATLAGLLDGFPELATVCVVPLGVSRHNTESSMRAHTVAEAAAVVDRVAEWQEVYLAALGRRVVFVSDEYHLLADRPFPPAEAYEGFPMHEDGVGMVRALEAEFRSGMDPIGVRPGFFHAVDGAPAEGYRAPRTACDAGFVAGGTSGEVATTDATAAGSGTRLVALRPRRDAPVAVLTGGYGAKVLPDLVAELGRPDVRVVEVENRHFGGTTAVAGLLTGGDVARVLADAPHGHRYLLPDVCLTNGRFLDDVRPEDLPRSVEVVPTDGASLRRALEAR